MSVAVTDVPPRGCSYNLGHGFRTDMMHLDCGPPLPMAIPCWRLVDPVHRITMPSGLLGSGLLAWMVSGYDMPRRASTTPQAGKYARKRLG